MNCMFPKSWRLLTAQQCTMVQRITEDQVTAELRTVREESEKLPSSVTVINAWQFCVLWNARGLPRGHRGSSSGVSTMRFHSNESTGWRNGTSSSNTLARSRINRPSVTDNHKKDSFSSPPRIASSRDSQENWHRITRVKKLSFLSLNVCIANRKLQIWWIYWASIFIWCNLINRN